MDPGPRVTREQKLALVAILLMAALIVIIERSVDLAAVRNGLRVLTRADLAVIAAVFLGMGLVLFLFSRNRDMLEVTVIGKSMQVRRTEIDPEGVFRTLNASYPVSQVAWFGVTERPDTLTVDFMDGVSIRLKGAKHYAPLLAYLEKYAPPPIR
jgi:hypothetical protein